MRCKPDESMPLACKLGRSEKHSTSDLPKLHTRMRSGVFDVRADDGAACYVGTCIRLNTGCRARPGLVVCPALSEGNRRGLRTVRLPDWFDQYGCREDAVMGRIPPARPRLSGVCPFREPKGTLARRFVPVAQNRWVSVLRLNNFGSGRKINHPEQVRVDRITTR